MKKFRRILGEDPGVGRPPLGTKHLFFFCELAKYTENKSNSSPPPSRFENSRSATELSIFNDSLYSVNAIEILNLNINWTKFPLKILAKLNFSQRHFYGPNKLRHQDSSKVLYFLFNKPVVSQFF
jgi:hypothetical protein